ncbi:MAG: hypothetical protein J4F36_11910 [Nitrosopumilaceae archaeon]|nr:hypothetical protein [Nitrosopumilaceae archaeon]
MKERKTNYRWFWKGINHGISPCCIMFFETAWTGYVKNEIGEYTDTMLQLTNNEQGVILCPDCVSKKITNSS